MRRRLSLRWAMVTILAFSPSFIISRIFVSARPAIEPFTLKTETVGFPAGKIAVVRSTETFAVRSDGTTATMATLPGRHGHGGEYERIVSSLDGGSVTYRPGISAKTTFGPRPEMAEAARAHLFNASADCHTPGMEVAGHDTIAGELVVVLRLFGAAPGTGVEFWLAPGLGCQQMQYRNYTRQPDGTHKLMTEMRTVSLIFGEPDAGLFAEPSSGYKEMKPSDVERAYAKRDGISPEQLNCERLDAADKNYLGIPLRPNSPPAK